MILAPWHEVTFLTFYLLSIFLAKIFNVNGPILATVFVNLLITLVLSNYINKNKLLT